jgi:hypothetical protein
MVFRERALHVVEGAGRSESLHRHDVGTVCLGRVLRTAAHRLSIDQNRTGPAYTVFTTNMDSEGLELMSQKIAEQHARLGLAGSELPIQGQLDRKALVGCTM